MIRLRSLGECVIEIGDEELTPESEIVFAFALYLIMNAGKAIPRATLTELFWPEVEARKARHCLRQTVYRLRQLGMPLGPNKDSIGCAIEHVTTSLHEAENTPDGLGLTQGLTHGLSYLPGYAPAFSEPFSEWIDAHRDLMHSQMRRTLLRSLAHARKKGRYKDVEALAHHCLNLDPLNEEATLALAEASAVAGSKAHALTLLDEYVRELGVSAARLSLPASILRRRIVDPSAGHQSSDDQIFVGRDDVIRELTEDLHAAKHRHGSASLIWGEPGVGKTRLLGEFLAIATVQGARVLGTRCESHYSLRPLSIFIDLAPKIISCPGAIGCSPQSLAFLQRLRNQRQAESHPQAPLAEADSTFSKVRQALLDAVDAIASEQTLVIYVDDVHWLDRSSWRILSALAASAPKERFLLLMSSRDGLPESNTVLPIKQRFLAPLSESQSAQLVTDLLANKAASVDQAFIDRCVRVTGGNPFFLRHLTQEWLERGEEQAIPDSIPRLLRERLDRLPESALLVLQACALLARTSTLQTLEQMLGYPTHELVGALEILEARGFILMEESRVLCRHDLLSEIALGRLGCSSRRLLHRRAGVLLEQQLESTGSVAAIWECAYHFAEAGETEHAVRLAHSRALHLLDLGLPHDAATLLRDGLTYALTIEERQTIVSSLVTACRQAGDWTGVARYAKQYESLSAEWGESSAQHTENEFVLLEARWRTNEALEPLIAYAEQCTCDGNASPEHRAQAAVWGLVFADNHCSSNAATRFHAFLRELACDSEALRRQKLQGDEIFHASYGSPEVAACAARQLVALERANGGLISRLVALRRASIPLRRVGAFDENREFLQEALAMAEGRSMRSSAWSASCLLALSALEESDVSSAARWYAATRRWHLPSEHPVESMTTEYLGVRLDLVEGRVARARERFERTIATSQVSQRRAELQRLALDVATRLARGDSRIVGGLLSRFQVLHDAIKCFGGCDFATAILLNGLLRAGDSERAASVNRDYLRARREISPIPEFLRDAIAMCR